MTRLFAPRADRRPRVFALPPGVDYAAAFAAGLAHRLDGHPPEAAARVDLLVNSTRARRTIEDALARRAGGAACFLPRITLTESALADPPPGLGPPGEAEPVCPLMRRLALTRLVERYADAGEIPRTAAPDLAQSLAELIDLMDEEGVDPALLDGAVAAEMAEHWQRSLAFLSIVREQWPALRETLAPGRLDPMAGEAARAGRLAAHWATHPPAHPVIAAGSTGARAVIATVLEAVATLDQGAVVLPGFDPSIDPDIWARAGDDHPMAPFRRLLDRLGIEPADVEPWDPAAPCPLRLDLLTEAMRPAPVTDAWIARRDDLARQAPTATAGVELIEAPHPRLEAEAIALAVREALETPGRTVAIVTRDASLARRVTAALARYAVLPDDSLGRPLALTPPAIFAELVLRVARAAAASRPDPVSLAALLAHPFARAGHPRRHHRRLARRFERRVLRGVRPVGRPGAVMPPWPDDPRHPPEPEDLAWAADVEAMLAPLIAALRGGAALGDLIAAHVAAIDALSAPVGAPSRADAAMPAAFEAEDTLSPWEGADGMAFRDLMDALGSAADAYAAAMEPAEYAALLDALARSRSARLEAARPHPRVAILGSAEARTAAADLTIVAGLNEGSWPGTADTGPWLNRPMRRALGLPAPEREVGLEAHDFLQAAARPEVVLTRSVSVEGTPQVASRWLVRLETLLQGTASKALYAMRARGRARLMAVAAVDRAAALPCPPAPRPCPCPPVERRPDRLSVTAIERLIRDPYAIYAEKVLRLDALEPLGGAPDARERGTVLHEIMHRFCHDHREALPGSAAACEALVRLAETVLAERVEEADLRRLWRGRLARVAEAVIAMEEGLRRDGRPEALERSGRLVLDLGGCAFAVTAQADRLDRAPCGGLAVYDYKAGAPPGKGQIGLYNHQLHVAALIAEAGGFEGVAPGRAVGGAYLGLAKGVRSAPKEGLGDLDAYRDRLAGFLAAYAEPTRGYLARRVPETAGSAGPYDHLARRAEWEGATAGDAP